LDRVQERIVVDAEREVWVGSHRARGKASSDKARVVLYICLDSSKAR
jgi:hypothetical protein